MIDEWHDRAYLECRAELHAGILQLITSVIRSLRKLRSTPQGEHPCAPSSSLPHQQR
jgi:hypothetical protein